MASETTNLHLVKSDQTEAVDIAPLNGNCDKIDEAYAALAAEIGNKVDKVPGKGLSTEDYTTNEKEKLGGLSGEDMFVLGDELASNSDLNTLTTVGCWRATTSAIATSISNIPADVSDAFFGATIPSVAGSRFIQILVPNNDTGDWYKRRYTGSWQTWVKYTRRYEEFYAGSDIPKNSDLNDYTTPGVYQCTGSTIGNTLSNSPTANPYRLQVKNFTSSSNVLQEITSVVNTSSGEPVVFRRVKLAAGWKAWYKWPGTSV